MTTARDIRGHRTTPAALAALWPLLGRPVALHRRLVDVCGGIKTALMLSQAIYWTRKGVTIAETDGWFHKRMADWRREIGLGRRSQERARRRLVALGVFEARLAGLPARLEYRVHLAGLGQLLATADLTVPGATMTASMAVFGAPLAFHASLVAVVGSVTGGLLLSRLLHLTRRRLLEGEEAASERPWLTLTIARWMDDTGLTRREFEGARDRLVEMGLIADRVRGFPPTLELRVDLTLLAKLLTRETPLEAPPLPNRYVLDKQECGIPAIKDAGLAQAGLSKTCISDWPERANQVVQNVHHRLAESGRSSLYMTTVLTTDLLPPPTQIERQTCATSARGGGESQITPLIYPAPLSEPERQVVGELLIRLPPDRAQLILDELDGRLRQAGTTAVANRVGYVRRLRDLQLAGAFVPETAHAVQAARQRRLDEDARRVRDEAERLRQVAIEATPEARAPRERAMAQAKAMLGMGLVREAQSC